MSFRGRLKISVRYLRSINALAGQSSRHESSAEALPRVLFQLLTSRVAILYATTNKITATGTANRIATTPFADSLKVRKLNRSSVRWGPVIRVDSHTRNRIPQTWTLMRQSGLFSAKD